MAFSAFLDKQILRHVFQNIPYQSPAQIFVGLYVGDPESGGVEYDAPSYSRFITTWTLNAANDEVSNATPIDWNIQGADPVVTITHIAAFNTIVGGNLLASGLLANPIVSSSRDQVQLEVGGMKISMGACP